MNGTAQTVLSQRDLLVGFYAAGVKQVRIEIEHATKENTWLSNASRKTGRGVALTG
jgi:hypothetical protein